MVALVTEGEICYTPSSDCMHARSHIQPLGPHICVSMYVRASARTATHLSAQVLNPVFLP
jgi:hypothetical protein